MSDGEKLIPINIEDEMKSAYIDYSMSVTVSDGYRDWETDRKSTRLNSSHRL